MRKIIKLFPNVGPLSEGLCAVGSCGHFGGNFMTGFGKYNKYDFLLGEGPVMMTGSAL